MCTIKYHDKTHISTNIEPESKQKHQNTAKHNTKEKMCIAMAADGCPKWSLWHPWEITIICYMLQHPRVCHEVCCDVYMEGSMPLTISDGLAK